ncbi:hypothetical protein Bpfe_025090 [Biomphalaria pfeifferi]|uniref:Uncharacterized protein n=1 Tax=Biomphalaria pfeifferi TaxID=112525 RepID=A0AAD8F0F3_BIOPF|nr:hypothetical protein Bpfe_025090 [Biomphalaria pfeifferi]
MAASKLYPTLSAFYRNTYVGFGSEANLTLSGADNSNPYKKPFTEDHGANILAKNKSQDKMDRKKVVSDKERQARGNNFDRTVVDNAQESSQEISSVPGNDHVRDDLADDSPRLPTAPPMDWSDDLIERFLQDTLTQQELSALENDLSVLGAPNIDYSALSTSLNVSQDSDTTWIDDLVPDYDTSPDDSEAGNLNNLNKERSSKPHTSAILAQNIVELPKPRSRPLARTEETHQRKTHAHRGLPRQAAVVSREAIYPPRIQHAEHSSHGNARLKSQSSQEKETKSGSSEDISAARQMHSSSTPPPPGTEEYSAWMTWRKQVNRQLASAILLRGNPKVQLHKPDQSRKALSQSSYDFISQFSKCGQKTPLGSKPFVMYGIPRVSLPNN